MVALAISAPMKRAGGASCLGRAYVMSPLNFLSKVGPETDEKGCGASRLLVGMTGAVVESLVCVAAAEPEDSHGHPPCTLKLSGRRFIATTVAFAHCCSNGVPRKIKTLQGAEEAFYLHGQFIPWHVCNRR